ncbi:MAG TPA: hypothetical protein VFS43_19175 [Polyangiaceae bacterium]|nr:hypothetical protein [Polyangiaceae bacterium]
MSPRHARRARRALAALAFALPTVGAARAALAAGPLDPPAMTRAMRDYFSAEKSEGFVFLGLGVGSAALGGYLLTRKEGFARGAAWPLLGLGLVEALGVGSYALGLDAKADRLERQIRAEPASYKREELGRMAGVKTRFVVYRFAELAILAAGGGLLAAGLVRDRDGLKGAGTALASHAALLLALDYFAERRAHDYYDQLASFAPPAAAPAAFVDPPRAFVLTARGSF